MHINFIMPNKIIKSEEENILNVINIISALDWYSVQLFIDLLVDISLDYLNYTESWSWLVVKDFK